MKLNLSIVDTTLYQELERRAADPPRGETKKLSQALVGALLHLEGTADAVLKLIAVRFPNYTDHGLQHSVRVVTKIGCILRDADLVRLTTVELFVLIAAALLHDVGMIDFDTQSDSEVRMQHHNRSSVLILELFGELFPTMRDDGVLARTVALVARAHGVSLNEFEGCSELRQTTTIRDRSVRPDLLAILLRIGDLLDADASRTCTVSRRIASNLFTCSESLAHHDRHQRVVRCRHDAEEIAIVAEANTPLEHQIWTEWFKFLREDVVYANTYIRPELNLRLPRVECQVQPTREARYELWDLRLQLDDSNQLWKIIGDSIYTTRLAFVRELASNAIDASLLSTYRSSTCVLEKGSPRAWYDPNEMPAVFVIYSSNSVSVVDSGVGMGRRELENFLFRVAASGYRNETRSRSFPFPSVAEFGIGFVSALSRAQTITITTRAEAPGSEPYRVEIREGSRTAYVEKGARSEPGTSVHLALNFVLERSELGRYLKGTFVAPCAKVIGLDLDAAKELCAKLAATSLQPPVTVKQLSAELAELNDTSPSLRSIEVWCALRDRLLAWSEDACLGLQDELRDIRASVTAKRDELEVLGQELNVVQSQIAVAEREIDRVQAEWQRDAEEPRADLRDATPTIEPQKPASSGADVKQSMPSAAPSLMSPDTRGRRPDDTGRAQREHLTRKRLEELQEHRARSRHRLDDHNDTIRAANQELSRLRTAERETTNVHAQARSLLGLARDTLHASHSGRLVKSFPGAVLSIPLIPADHSRRRGSAAASVILWVPVEHVDHDLGIEWYSVHGFLSFLGDIRDEVVVYTRDGQGPLRAMAVDEYEEIAGEIAERRARGRHLFEEEDVLEEDWDSGDSEEDLDADYDDHQACIYRMGIDGFTREICTDQDVFKTVPDLLQGLAWYEELDNAVLQDGIPLPIRANEIVSFGVCRARVNLTGNARFKLNATREAIDESPRVLADWMDRVGGKIQAIAQSTFDAAFAALRLDVSCTRLAPNTPLARASRSSEA